MPKASRHLKSFMLIILSCFLIIGCGTTNVQKKTTGGIGIGALAGGLITGDVSGIVAGAAVGGVSGYAVGTDQDRHAEKMALEKDKLALEKEQTQIAKAKITSDPSTAYRPASRNELVGSTWRVISIVGEQPYPEFHSMVVTFQTNSKVTTLLAYKDGSADTVAETYQILEDVMVVSGLENGKKYVVDGKYDIKDDQFVFVTPTYRVVGEKVQ